MFVFIKGVLVCVLFFVIGKWIFFKVFSEIVLVRIDELFMLIMLLVVLFVVGFIYLFGLLMVLGVFLVGMMLGESYYCY